MANGYNRGEDGKRYTTPIELNIAAFDALENASPEDKQAALLNIISTIIHEYIEDFGSDAEDYGNGEFGAYETQQEIFYGERPGIVSDDGKNVDLNFTSAKKALQKMIERSVEKMKEDMSKHLPKPPIKN
jgi:hypothetical protein